MMGNNAAGAVQQLTHVKPDPDSKTPGVPPSRTPLAGGPVMNGKVKRAPVRRGKRSMYDTSSSSEEEEEEEQSDEEDDEVHKPLSLPSLRFCCQSSLCIACSTLIHDQLIASSAVVG